jgi:hypothetical protein
MPPAPQVPSGGVPTQMGGGGILGVASKSKEASIRIYKGRSHYNEWNFISANASSAPGGGQGAPMPGGRGGSQMPGGRGPGGRGDGRGFPGRGGPGGQGINPGTNPGVNPGVVPPGGRGRF